MHATTAALVTSKPLCGSQLAVPISLGAGEHPTHPLPPPGLPGCRVAGLPVPGTSQQPQPASLACQHQPRSTLLLAYTYAAILSPPIKHLMQKRVVEMFRQAKHWPDACGGHTSAVEALRRSAPTHHSRGQGDSHFEPECRLGPTYYCPILHRCQQLGLERQGKGCIDSAGLCMSDLNWLLLLSCHLAGPAVCSAVDACREMRRQLRT